MSAGAPLPFSPLPVIRRAWADGVDAPTLAGVAVLVGVVALLAIGRPAWRAARVDPVVALRSE